MKGYGMIGLNNAGWMEKDAPVCDPIGVIVRPVVVAPCTSDVHTLKGGSGSDKANIILGHEAVGEIVEVGSLVKRFKPGDIVVVPAGTPNWLNPNTQGLIHQHDEGMMKSFKFTVCKDGVFAEVFHVNHADANLALLPPEVKPEDAVMVTDMMSTGFYGVELAEVGFGDTVVVIGIGPVGLMAVAGSMLRGAGRIIGIGTRPNCVKIAKEYGATDIVSYKDGDIVKQVLGMTGGADAVIIAGGNKDTMEQAIRMVKPGGVVSNVNYFDATDVFTIPAYIWGLGMANKDIRGGFCPGGAKRMEALLNILRYGRVDASKLITHRYNGFEKIEDAFKLMDEKPAELIKPVVFI